MEETEIKTKLTYDDRRKQLIQEKIQTVENKTKETKDENGEIQPSKLISTVEHSMKATYTEEGIRLAHKNLCEEINFIEKKSEILKHQFENEVKLTEEELNLKKMLKKITLNDSVEKAKNEYTLMQERFKEASKELSELKSTIGDRLKF